MPVLKFAKIAMRPNTISLQDPSMAKRQFQPILLIGRGANHATAPVPSMLKKAGEEVLPFLRLAKRKVLLPGIQNVSHAMKI
jgi:hypothetical protein